MGSFIIIFFDMEVTSANFPLTKHRFNVISSVCTEKYAGQPKVRNIKLFQAISYYKQKDNFKVFKVRMKWTALTHDSID